MDFDETSLDSTMLFASFLAESFFSYDGKYREAGEVCFCADPLRVESFLTNEKNYFLSVVGNRNIWFCIKKDISYTNLRPVLPETNIFMVQLINV